MDTLPSVQTSESSVLSILMNKPEAFDDCPELQPEHFPTDWLRTLFVEMRRQHAKGPFDLVSLADALKFHIPLADLHAILEYSAHSARAFTVHVQKLIDARKSRQLYYMSGLLHELAFETSPIQERIDRVQGELIKLEDAKDADEWVDAYQASIEHLDLIEAREAGSVKGIPTGLTDLDELLDGGFQRGNLVVIGARPAMGKTALGLTVGLHVSEDYHVGVLSMEMPHADMRDRQTAILGNVAIGSIKRPKKGLEFDRISDAIEKSKTRKFYVSDKSGLNILQVRAKARALKRRKGLDVLVVDYIGLMSGLDPKAPRAYQIEEISRGLKTLAKDLSIIVICLAQVNRGAADRGNQCPALHDLRDSGAIEQDADVVGFIHRPIQADPNLGAQWADYGLLRIAKNRQGRTGDVHLYYVANQTRFGAWGGEPPTNSTQGSKSL